jgi:glycerol-3-phosphate acyltransferase PlsY
MLEAVVVIVSYLFGSIPVGLLLSNYLGYGDIRKKGSGNIGATNALRVGGKKLGIATLILDCVKGILPLLIFKYCDFDDHKLALSGFCVVIGHIYPVWLKFQGGKGVATTFAVLLILTPYVAFVFALAWSFIFFIMRIVSVASLVAMLTAAIASLWFTKTPYFVMTACMLLCIFYRHQENIDRLIHGKELTFKPKK